VITKLPLVILFLAGFIALLSCSKETDSTLNDSLKIEIVKYHKKSAGCNGSVQDNCAEIKIEFPQFTMNNKTVEEKINSAVYNNFVKGLSDTSFSASFEEIMDRFINEYDAFIKEYSDSPQRWIIERTGKIIFNKVNIISLDCTDYSYTGGAHPNTYVTFINFNLKNGNEIKLDELIQPSSQNELRMIAELEFRILKELKPDDDLGQAGFWFENNQFKLNDNFLITDSSLVFYYNNYEITAYAFGPTELVIPYLKIKNLVDENSLLSPLMN